MSVVDFKTPRLQLPLPNGSNFLADDVLRLIQAITKLDQIVATTDVLSSFVASTDLMSALQSYALLGGSSTQTFFVGNSSQAGHAVNQGQLYGRAGSGGGLSFRNKIVDGRFDFWYEGTSQTTSGYGSDTMWYNYTIGSTQTVSQQPLTAGVDLPRIDCPSARYFSRTVVASVAGAGNCIQKVHKIEDVSCLSGKTATLSFYAKADAVKNIGIELYQGFGTGGSTDVGAIGSQLITLSTTWQRYSKTITIPSLSGKTIGGSSTFSVVFWFDAGTNWVTRSANLGQQSGTFDIACVQLEEGSVATPFEELPIEISLSRVNRYYEAGSASLIGSAAAAGNAYISRDYFADARL